MTPHVPSSRRPEPPDVPAELDPSGRRPRRRPPAQSEIRGISTIASLPDGGARRGAGERRTADDADRPDGAGHPHGAGHPGHAHDAGDAPDAEVTHDR